MNCPECDSEMGEPVDTTYSNINTERASKGQHTGNIYWCEQCECHYLDNFLTHQTYPWKG